MRYLSLFTIFVLAACSFSQPPERTRYALDVNAYMPPARGGIAHEGVLRVAMPTASYDLDNDTIEVEAGSNIETVENAAWADRLPAMLQSVTIAALEHAGRYRDVVDDTSPALASRELHLRVERFTLIYAKGSVEPHVEVVLRAEFIAPGGNKLLRVKRIEASEPVETLRMHFVVPAFERALARCLEDVTGMVK